MKNGFANTANQSVARVDVLNMLLNNVANNGIIPENITVLEEILESVFIQEALTKEELIVIQALLLYIDDAQLPLQLKRIVNELKYSLIRKALGPHYRHGTKVAERERHIRHRAILTEIEHVDVYEDGFTTTDVVKSIHGAFNPADESPLNDSAAVLFNKKINVGGVVDETGNQ